jgi:tRNA pseudouridine38-40 synthase
VNGGREAERDARAVGARRQAGEGRGRSAEGHGDQGAAVTWRLDLAYEGTAYRGWAKQPGHRTVEGILEEALATVLRVPVRLSVAGRTDAGVHAWAQVASFSCASLDLAPERLRRSLNGLLPPDVAVIRVAPAPSGFAAREAASRTYCYDVWATAVRPVRERAFVWAPRGGVDGAALVAAAGLLPGRRDFAALTPSARLYHSCVREVTAAFWTDAGPTPDGEGRRWRFEVTAGSFLHNMVRVAVGSMVDVAQGRTTLDEFEEALASGERPRMGQTAPARGLALVAVSYTGEPAVTRPGSA